VEAINKNQFMFDLVSFVSIILIIPIPLMKPVEFITRQLVPFSA